MTSVAEQRLARELRAVLIREPVGGNIGESGNLREVLTALEFYRTNVDGV